MKYLLAAVLVLGIGCDQPPGQGAVSHGWVCTTRTVEHDGHKFICFYTGSTDGGISALHHPDCTCKGK